uniref:RNase H type-1 domain-containing protein n=1 Tax=viral metagenome TaxID=1070528 RepID=A0A6C0BTG6_9ZZZZ
MQYYLYFDGGCRGNGRANPNARAGYGYVIYNDKNARVADGWAYLGAKTNNYAEYSGLINGMQHALTLGITTLVVRGDSNMVIKQMTGQFGTNNPDMKILNGIAKELAANFASITYEHVYREDNKEADRLSNVAMDNPKPSTECEDLLKKAQTETQIGCDDVIITIKKKKIGACKTLF